MQKAHNAAKNDFWHNRPDTSSPITETELNRIETNIDTIDDRVVTFDVTKANQSDLLTCVSGISLNTTTGILTITLKNGTTSTLDTGLAKLAINFDYDDDPTSAHYQQIILEMKDGTYKYIDLSALITQYEFVNTSTIIWTIESDGKIKANVPNGSITAEKLQPNYLADITTQANRATGAVTSTEANRLEAEGWTKGTQNGNPVSSDSPYYENNAKYYKEGARAIVGNKVDTFNGRSGMVLPTDGDYNISQISPLNGSEEGQVPVVDENGKFTMGYGGRQIYTCLKTSTDANSPTEISLTPFRKEIELNGPIAAKVKDENRLMIQCGSVYYGRVSSINPSEASYNTVKVYIENGNIIGNTPSGLRAGMLKGSTFVITNRVRYIGGNNSILMQLIFNNDENNSFSAYLTYGGSKTSSTGFVNGNCKKYIAPNDVFTVVYNGSNFCITSLERYSKNWSTGFAAGNYLEDHTIPESELDTVSVVLQKLWQMIDWKMVSHNSAFRIYSIGWNSLDEESVNNDELSGPIYKVNYLNRYGWDHSIVFERSVVRQGSNFYGLFIEKIQVSDILEECKWVKCFHDDGQSQIVLQDASNDPCKSAFEIIY